MKRIACVLILFCVALPTFARSTQVRAVVEPHEALLGDTVQYGIIVRDARNPKVQNLTLPDGLRAGGASMQQSMNKTVINGRIQQTTSSQIVYPIVASRLGTFTIPSQTVIVDGQTYTTQPVSFRVTEPPISETNHITISTDTTSAYVGEPVEITVKWYFADFSPDHLFQFEGDGAQFDVYRSRYKGSARQPVNFERFQIVPDHTQEYVDNVPTHVLTFRVVVIPKVAGPLNLGPVLGQFRESSGFVRRGLFREQTYSRSVARSEPIVLDVKALPAPKPDNFTGLVGAYIVSTEVVPSEASVGDPLTLRLKILGPDPLERIEPPSIESLGRFAESFRFSPEGWQNADQSTGEIRIFETTIRATSETVTELGPVELEYFDSVDEEYRVAASRPFPLTIHPTRQVTADDALVADSGSAPGLGLRNRAQTTLALAPLSVHANREGPSLLTLERTNFLAVLTSPAGLAVTIAPPALYAMALVLVATKRRRDPVRFRRRRALGHAVRALKEDEPVAAIQHFFADWFPMAPEAVTSRDVEQLLAERVSTETAQGLADSMRALERANSQGKVAQLEQHDLVMRLTSVHKELLSCDFS